MNCIKLGQALVKALWLVASCLSMGLDHTEFITRKKTIEGETLQGSCSPFKGIIVSTIFTILYVSACVGLAIVMGGDKTIFAVGGLLFIIISIIVFWFQRCFRDRDKKDKERRLIREVLEGSRGARMITDGANKTVYFNQRFEKICSEFGAPNLESLARLFIDNVDAPKLFNTLCEQARRGLTESMELRSGKGEQERWFVLAAQPVAGWAGYVHWRIDDITRQRDLDHSVRKEREKLIDFTDNAPVGFFSVDEKGRFVFVNATLARWLGADIESLLKEGTLHTYLETPPLDAALYDIMEKGGAHQVCEVVMKGLGGRTFLASVNQAVVRDDDGRVRTRGVVYDLTSEREIRQALKVSEDRFQRFFEEAPLGIALVDPDGVVHDCNTALAKLLGRDVKNVEDQNLRKFIAEEDENSVLRAVGLIEPGRQMSAPVEVRLLNKEGKNVPVSMYARRFKNSDDVVLHFINLTEQKEIEEQFVQSQKMQAVGQLAGGIAHDFNNLLTAIIGFCDLLLLRHKPGDSSFGDIMHIKQNSNRASNLVRQLLAFSRQQTLRPKVHDVTDILTEVSHLLRRLIGSNIELELIHGSDLGLVKIDLGQMEQVLINLAVNARDAMENGGHLNIQTENFSNAKSIKRGDDKMPPGEWVCIAVEDTGCGISDENIARILEPFFTTKGVGQGTGLGLATVYGIIRQTGGYLDIESTEEVGTTFSIYLPRLSEDEVNRLEEEDEEEEQEVVVTDLTGTARILLVEDESAVRTFSTRALVNKGYKVIDAENGKAALKIMEGEEDKNIDLLITDVMMPDMDGPTLVKHMRKEYPKLRIIFISGYTEDKLKDHMGDNIYFLPKPFTLKQLAAKVKEALVE